MILLVDNYDSFVFNLARYVAELGYERRVVRNDAIGLSEIEAANPSHIVLSPGPCGPDEAGISVALVRRFGARIPILGVCLGHQCIAVAYGGRVGRARRPMHGRTSPIVHRGTGVFSGLPSPLRVTRYHSLIVEDEGLPDDLEVTARSPEGEIMAIAHRRHPVHGVQFHPEAVLTEHGYDLLRNFLALRAEGPSAPSRPEGHER
ncbi:MAG: aminodeoxychorismate/anthranilate synthase component II [Geminicoccaceae bacterium]|nr:aminodeoxychorismate/anthranilate synthase component II [Geminicoccaceae bacterium]MCS7268159.1 aminodeoxychorismate/anthranilate synthase component II [Geminicoccaceae bacterium]MDW8125376.1 aminodeoxychorismate/anthranilate synthase component II [Geminicoccaceae bacterium]MDW8342105.1 aminodeoxychorismate/anthranilate synthase component II [Geminicoccaceae bacterium]MDW8444058.1 aminodeoxychorismate/anthranilate synthase component II [Acetobacteraceae bacterium]